jgi:hypothetical protein
VRIFNSEQFFFPSTFFFEKESRQTRDSRVKVFSKKDVEMTRETNHPLTPSLKRRGERLSPNPSLKKERGNKKLTLSGELFLFS